VHWPEEPQGKDPRDYVEALGPVDELRYTDAGHPDAEGFRYSYSDAGWLVLKARKFSTFGLNTPGYTLNVSWTGGGRVMVDEERLTLPETLLLAGDAVGMRAAASAGWEFAGWRIGGAEPMGAKADPLLAFQMPGNDVSVVAAFTALAGDDEEGDGEDKKAVEDKGGKPPEDKGGAGSDATADAGAPADDAGEPADDETQARKRAIAPAAAGLAKDGETADGKTRAEPVARPDPPAADGEETTGGEPRATDSATAERGQGSGWALLNLICAAIGIATAIVQIPARKRGDKGRKRRPYRLLPLIPAAVGAALFLLLEDLGGAVSWTDRYTPLFAAVLCAGIITTAAIGRKAQETADTEENQ
jgi:hypothetical protein